MPRRASRARVGLAGALLVLLGACAVAPPPEPAPPPARPLAPAEVETVARLLRASDARDPSEPLLREAAASAAPEVRRQAALAAARLRPPGGADLLRGLLDDPDSAVAATAAFGLGRLGDTAAVADLAPLLSPAAAAERPTVASEAAYALGRLPSAASAAALVELLSRPGEEPREPIGSALLAVWRLPRLADLSPVVRWTASPDAELRWRAAYALSRRPTPAATRVLLALAEDPDPRVRSFAVRGLTAPLADSSGVGAGAALPGALAAAADTAYAVRINALRSLGSFADPRAVAALAAAAGEGGHPALTAVESLGRLGPAAASTAGALASLAGDAAAPLAIRQEALAALVAVDPGRALPLAERLAGDPEWRLRAAAGRALARAAGPRSPTVGRLVRDRDGRVAAATLQAVLDAAGESLPSVRPLLLESLGSPDVWVRVAALGGLAGLAEPSTLPALLDAYQRAQADSLNDAALAALDALSAVGGGGGTPQRAFFARFARSPDYLVRLRARERFGAAADSAWGEPLPIETGRPLEHYRALVERWIAPPAPERPVPSVTLETERGTLRLRLFPADSPLTVESLLGLAERGYFDAQEWPRVVPNFVVQGGDPRGDTNGGPGYAIRDEGNRHRYGPGSLGMALSGPDTGGSQFFVTHSPQPHLDGDYTIFGELVEGHEATRSLLPGDRILSLRIAR